MKNIIVTIGEILLGVILFLFIMGTTNSFKSESTRIFNSTIDKVETVQP